ncbi:hypothetical protein PG997_008784 [Apiospora hydei]|uniref:Uncharacterized protein n=1 Tax=Apiospora hydei TaxID=1337664 RepID=A0ABR1WBT8_9PEZI
MASEQSRGRTPSHYRQAIGERKPRRQQAQPQEPGPRQGIMQQAITLPEPKPIRTQSLVQPSSRTRRPTRRSNTMKSGLGRSGSLNERFPGDMSHRPLEQIKRENKVAQRVPGFARCSQVSWYIRRCDQGAPSWMHGRGDLLVSLALGVAYMVTVECGVAGLHAGKPEACDRPIALADKRAQIADALPFNRNHEGCFRTSMSTLKGMVIDGAASPRAMVPDVRDKWKVKSMSNSSEKEDMLRASQNTPVMKPPNTNDLLAAGHLFGLPKPVQEYGAPLFATISAGRELDAASGQMLRTKDQDQDCRKYVWGLGRRQWMPVYAAPTVTSILEDRDLCEDLETPSTGTVNARRKLRYDSIYGAVIKEAEIIHVIDKLPGAAAVLSSPAVVDGSFAEKERPERRDRAAAHLT